jgi:hypothetical protein
MAPPAGSPNASSESDSGVDIDSGVVYLTRPENADDQGARFGNWLSNAKVAAGDDMFAYMQFVSPELTEFGTPFQQMICEWAMVDEVEAENWWNSGAREEMEGVINTRRNNIANTNMKKVINSKSGKMI